MIKQLNTSSRGQLLIVTAVVIAALLISLAVVFNTALFTEAESTSVTFSDTARGESLKDSHITNIAQTIEAENEQMDGSAAADTEAIITNINTQTNQRQTKYGAIASITHDSTTGGTRVEWDNSNAYLTDEDGDGTWNVTNGIGNIRGFSMNFSTLPSTQSNAFVVSFNPDDGSETATRYFHSSGGSVQIQGKDETGAVTTSCSINDQPTTTIDFTRETLRTDDEESLCRDLWPDFDVNEIQFENGNDTKGRFEYVISSGSIAPDDGGAHSEIQDAQAVYALRVIYEYTTANTEYTTSTRIAPGEP